MTHVIYPYTYSYMTTHIIHPYTYHTPIHISYAHLQLATNVYIYQCIYIHIHTHAHTHTVREIVRETEKVVKVNRLFMSIQVHISD